MRKSILVACAALLVLGFIAHDASACWDNSDGVIASLKKLDLTTDQLKDVFKFQKEHRDVIVRAHKEGLGCRYHENHDVVFEKKAIGVLTNVQFKKHTGRTRTKVESLEHDNWELRKKIERLEKKLKELQKKLEKLSAKKK